MGEIVPFRMPWEPAPVTLEGTAKTLELLQADMRFAMAHTGVLVHSNRVEMQMLVNTARGQIIPKGECWFTDGSKVEMQDIGMPQPNATMMTVPELVARVFEIAAELGLTPK